jgi:hypothetical protein
VADQKGQPEPRAIGLGEYPGTALSTILFGLFGATGLALLAWKLGATDQDRYVNLTVSLLGASMGCSIAVLSSPYSEADSAKFTKVLRSASVFGSGYLLSKFDKVLEVATDPKELLSQTVLLRMAFFAIGFIVVGMGTLASRLYFNQRQRLEERRQYVGASPDAQSGTAGTVPTSPQ